MRRLTLISATALLAFLLLVPPAWAEWVWPVRGEVVTPYRNGTDPYASGQHRGIDISAGSGTTVVAAAGGVVRFAGTAGSSGLTVSVRTADGRYDTSYLHLSSTNVREGDQVAAGQRLGSVGTTGTRSASAPHLHFGVRDAGSRHAYHDPLGFLPPPATQPPQGAPAPAQSPVPVSPAPAPVRSPAPSPHRVPAGAPRRVPSGAPRRVPAGAPRRVPSGAPRRMPAGEPRHAPSGEPQRAPAGDPHRAPAGDPHGAPAGDPHRAPAGDSHRVPLGEPHRVPLGESLDALADDPLGEPHRVLRAEPGRIASEAAHRTAARDHRPHPVALQDPSDAAAGPPHSQRVAAAAQGNERAGRVPNGSPSQSPGPDFGLLVACLGLLAAAALLGLTGEGRKATRETRHRITRVLQPLLGRR